MHGYKYRSQQQWRDPLDLSVYQQGKSYYFDSYGFGPTLEVQEYCKEPRVYSSLQIQKMNQVICGHYCIYVLYRLSNGQEFYDILDELRRNNE